MRTIGALVAACACAAPRATLPTPPRAQAVEPLAAYAVVVGGPRIESSRPRCEAIRLAELTSETLPAIEGELPRFHRKLATLSRGLAHDHVRIAIYGDSNMTRDWISGELRRVLQKRFGDGGHGFVALGKPWNWYIHTDIEHNFWPNAFKTYVVSTAPLLDRMYGFAQIATEPLYPGARTWVNGAAASIELFYLQRPGAGRVALQVDDAITSVDASGPTAAAFRRVSVDDGAHAVRVVGQTFERVRLYGVTMERRDPGVVVDSLGVGAMTSRLLTLQEPTVSRAMLARRDYDLVIFLLDTGLWAFFEEHREIIKKVIALHRAAIPDVDILLLSPPDHASSLQATSSDARVVRIGREKRIIAKELGVGFWDFREAMGGDLSIVRFCNQRMAWTDLIHFTEKGGRLMGGRLAEALQRDFARAVAAHPELGCEP